MTTLAALLADQGIRPRKLSPGAQHLDCPRCCPAGKPAAGNAGSLSLSIDDDGTGAVWTCHRGSCGWRDSVRVNGHGPTRLFEPARPKPQRAPPPPPDSTPAWFTAFWDARRIGTATLNRLGVYAGRRYFNPGGEQDCIVFPYWHEARLVGAKYRAVAQKQHSQDAPNPPTLFNADSIKPGCTLIWAEGEPDVCAIEEVRREHGHVAVVSLKDGAPAKPSETDKRLAALETHKAALGRVKLHVIATDTDIPGEALAEELSRRLGRHRCRRWQLPADCKDACDVLRVHGAEALHRAITEAQPYPIQGVRRIPGDYLQTLYDRPAAPVMSTGTPSLDAILRLPMDGRLIVLTGQTNHGKSTWLRHTMVHTARRHERKWLAFVAEDDFDSCLIECAEMIMAEGFRRSTPEQRAEANALLTRSIETLEFDNESDPPTVEAVLQRAEAAALGRGITDLAIDPWNELEQQRGDMSESDYAARSLMRFKAFAKRHSVNVWLVAHPDKANAIKARDTRYPPDGHSIAGSMAFGNKSDLGISILRGKADGETEIHIWKSRKRRWGTMRASVKLRFDPVTNCFGDTESAARAANWTNATED